MSSPVSIAVHGASGRMGRAILRIAFERPTLRVVAAIVRSGAANTGKPLSGDFGETARVLSYSPSLGDAATADVLVDFSTPDAFDAALAFAIEHRLAFVSGTTGITPEQRAAIQRAGASIPVLWSANFSIGVAVLMQLARDAARALPGWDCEIFDAHHRDKKDAPSGTALALGRAIATERGVDLDSVARYDANKSSPAQESSTIGFASVRGGDLVGEHTVYFANSGERIELTHRATDRDIFARGALDAAEWLAGRDAGVHTLSDLFAR
ncbi:MAG: 4-hydroxy-tetrahydrodipicolinate reductase [Rhodanobacteraceae bacterium]